MTEVFVIEAEDLIRETLFKVMKAEGYGVITASDGHAALTLLQSLALSQKKFPFNLIILAWILPQVGGAELCCWLRQRENIVPILVLNAKESEAEPLSILQAGANDYLLKPFSPQELVARCQVLLRYHHLNHLPQPTMLQFEEVSLYPQEHRVTLQGKEVNLSLKEFRLLELFISSPRQIWSRQQLLEEVWEPQREGSLKTLDVHIHWLRKKLELRPGKPKYIKTVPRVGYRFI